VLADRSNGLEASEEEPPIANRSTLTIIITIAVILIIAGCDDDPTSSPDGPTHLEALLGDSQTGTVGRELPNDLVVRVTDASGQPVKGVEVQFALVAGGGMFLPSCPITDRMGVAATTLTLGAQPGVNEVTASATGLGSVSFTANAFNPITLDSLVKGINWIELHWSHVPSEGFQAFEVYGGQSFLPFPDTGASITIADESARRYVDQSVFDNSSYYYSVAARYAGGYDITSHSLSANGGIAVDLEGVGCDCVIDSARHRIYVAAGGLIVLSDQSLQILDRIYCGYAVSNIDMSPDGSRLYVAVGNSIDIYDPDSWTVTDRIDISAQVECPTITDFLAVGSDKLFVTGCGSRLVLIELDNGYQCREVGPESVRIDKTILTKDDAETSLYMNWCDHDTHRLWKLDLLSPDIPQVWQIDVNHPGYYDNWEQFAVTPDGLRVVLSHGPVVETATGTVIGRFEGYGVPQTNGDGSRVYLTRREIEIAGSGTLPAMITVFDAETYQRMDTILVDGETVRRTKYIPDDDAIIVFVDALMYGVSVSEISAND
jgi:hypothetical protein